MSLSRMSALLLGITALLSCKKEKTIVNPPSPEPGVLLKEIIENYVPSPYYYFEYDSLNRVSFVSFASDYNRYHVVHDNGRIVELNNDIVINKDRLQYAYDNVGRVQAINYADSTGNVYRRVDLFYEGKDLVKLNRLGKAVSGFVLEKEITMSYYADGNLMDIRYHYLPGNGGLGSDYSIHYENYDNKLNVDGFGLLHNDFFDHFFLLPGVQLQKNNPQKETLSAEDYGYTVTYSYTYNEKKAPLLKSGDLLYLDGPQKGNRIVITSTFSYY